MSQTPSMDVDLDDNRDPVDSSIGFKLGDENQIRYLGLVARCRWTPDAKAAPFTLVYQANGSRQDTNPFPLPGSYECTDAGRRAG